MIRKTGEQLGTPERCDEVFLECDCGWVGDGESLDMLGADGDCGLCPDCGSEDFAPDVFDDPSCGIKCPCQRDCGARVQSRQRK
jgi:hypothetical protein